MIFCPPNNRTRDLDNLVGACKWMLDGIAQALSLSDSQRDAMAARARAHVVENFSVEGMCGRTLAVYDGLLEARRAAAWATR